MIVVKELEIRGVEFVKLTRLDYEEKVKKSIELISKAHEIFRDKMMVSWSGGKDSTVVIHLTRKVNPNVYVVFANTLIEYPETYEFVRRLSKEWKLNYHEVRPPKGITYWKIVEKEGFPKVRWGRHKPTCCTLLKTYPLQLFSAKHMIKLQVIGFTHDESRTRFMQLFKNGLFQYVEYRKGTDVINVYKLYPIGFWTVKDVWRYIKENNIPINKVYEQGFERVGCMPCTAHLGWREVLARKNPKMLQFILNKMREMGDERAYQMGLEEFPCEVIGLEDEP